MLSAPGSRRSLTGSQPKLAVGTGSEHHQPTAPLCWVLYVFMDSPELTAGGHDEIRSPRGRLKPISLLPNTKQGRKLVNTTPRRLTCAVGTGWRPYKPERCHSLLGLLICHPTGVCVLTLLP